METKVCGRCKKEFPKTREHFYTKKYKQKLVDGTYSRYTCLRSVCKKCNTAQKVEKSRAKRCEELGCTLNEYESIYRRQQRTSRMKYPELIDIPEPKRVGIRRWIENGYAFTTVEQYELDWRKQRSRDRRKYDYGDVDFVTSKLSNDMQIKNLTRGRLALGTNFSAKDMPEEVYQLKKTIILLKRELKNNNVKIR